MYREYNPNPKAARVGDCVIRACAKALNMDWDSVYAGIAAQGFTMKDMPSSNRVWGTWLKEQGLERRFLRLDCPDCYTVKDFCEEYPRGRYIVALVEHVVAVVDGDYYDTWDSGDEAPQYYWEVV